MLVALLAVLGCSGGPAEEEAPAAPEPAWGAARETQGRLYRVEVSFEPEPVMGELFSARTVVTTRDGQPVERADVKVDALMPHHGHGMETRPVMRPGDCDDEGTCTHPGGVYVADGFKLHMGGPWTVTVDVDGPRGRDTTSFVYEMK